jgi:hypothetical protein
MESSSKHPYENTGRKVKKAKQNKHTCSKELIYVQPNTNILYMGLGESKFPP